MVDDRCRVVAPQHQPGAGQVNRPRQPGCVDSLRWQARQLRQVAADELALRVKALALRYRVEDAEPGLGVAAGGRRPLPAAVVGGQVEVDQVAGEVGLTPAPVQAQVLDQKACHHHPQTVVHVAGLVDLLHRRIDQRVAGAAIAPGGKVGIGLRPLRPGHGIEFGLEGMAHHARMVEQDLVVEVAPDQLGQPDLGAA